MFNSKGKTGARPNRRSPSLGTPTVIGPGFTVTGDISGDCEVLIEGRLEGCLNVKKVVVLGAGTVQGDLIADEAVIDGTVLGVVDARSVILTESANVQGEVIYSTLSMAVGAAFAGRTYIRPPDTEPGHRLPSPPKPREAPASKKAPRSKTARERKGAHKSSAPPANPTRT